MWPVRDFEGKLLEGWERGKSEKGISYYIYHSGEYTQWDHPLLKSAIEDISNCNSINYVAYRTASKCRILQKLTKFHLVKLPTVVSQFDQHGFRENDSVMLAEQLENLLTDLYIATLRDQAAAPNCGVLAEVAANIFINIYDRPRNGAIRVLSAKILLTLLCSGRLQEKYKYLFRQFADHNNYISRAKLVELLRDMSYIPEYISEKTAFGSQLVELTANSCCKPESMLDVTEEAFMEWLLREPQTLVWISTLYRITLAETSIHDLKCSVCKTYPMTGLRYQCLRCFQFDLCQNCFFTGQSTKRHKLYHPLQEYCYRPTSKEGTKAFMTTIKNMFSKKTAGNMKQRYLPISQATLNNIAKNSPTLTEGVAVDDEESSKCASEDIIDNCETPVDSRTVYYESLQRNNFIPKEQKDLSDIILRIEEENRQLHAEVENFRNANMRNLGSTELKQAHSQSSLNNTQLEVTLNKLRSLLMHVQEVYQSRVTPDLEEIPLPPPRYESTPARLYPGKQLFNMESPIDSMYDCAISNISSVQSTPQKLVLTSQQPQQWDQRLGILPLHARRSLPLNSFQRAYPANTNAFQPTTRSSARAILQTRSFVANGNSTTPNDSVTYYVNNYQTEDVNPPFNDVTNRSQNDMLGDNTSAGLGRIQNELESIIRQLEAVYPGCSGHQTMAGGNVSDKYRIMTAANEIETMLKDLVAKVTLTGDQMTNSIDNIPTV
ncbi:hypothetical protein CHUAL_006522 [Chamberlinius hualienensis]